MPRINWGVFTGIVQAVGAVAFAGGGRLRVLAPDAWPGDPWKVGESVAVDGCCLTVAEERDGLWFDLSVETLERTTLRSLVPGGRVNLERAMKASDRLGGHIVLGHVDTTGALESRNGLFAFRVDEDWSKFLLDKGSIAVNGVSLTVVQPEGGCFKVAMVPHTLLSTTMGAIEPGETVNVELDVLAKYVLSRP